LKDIFGNINIEKPVRINIYADEIQGKKCPYTKSEWDYIGIIIEKTETSFLEDIIHERFMGNFDENSSYYDKNNKSVHWCEMRIADTKNICKRWLQYVMDPSKSGGKLYSYVLGINNSHIIKEEFDLSNEFNSVYNRFFRSAVLYAIKTFFSNQRVIVENIYHEEGQQQEHDYFPWHVIYKLGREDNIVFNCDRVTFLPKDHKIDKRSNAIQVCDCILGVTTSLIHGIEESNASHYREELLDFYSPLLNKMMNEPRNPNSSYGHHKRLLVRFFPKEKTFLGDYKRDNNQFYSKRELHYIEKKSGQQCLF